MLKDPWRKIMSWHLEVPVMLVSSLLTLGYGLTMPTITMKELVFWTHTFSILTGIQSLLQEKHYALAILIFLFSVLFPIGKSLTLTWVWFGPLSKDKRLKLLRLVETFGRWSMLDVFVVAVVIVITKTSGLVKAEPHVGIYVFAVSVILSMLLTMRIQHLIKKA